MKWTVDFDVEVEHRALVEVEADSEDEAREKARARFSDLDDADRHHVLCVIGKQISSCEPS
jgi:hypothetical protein